MPWPRVKITVLKRALYEDICTKYGSKAFLDHAGCTPCSVFRDGQEFILERGLQQPEGFCTYAFADIRHELMVILNGGNRSYIGPKGTAIVCCTDAMKPVLFKIERIESS